MDYNVLFETGNSINKLSKAQVKINNSKQDKGFASLKKGQYITGTVVSVGEQVTLDFYGKKANAAKNVIGDVKIGEVKTFEVMKLEGQEIELRLLDSEKGRPKASFKAALIKDTDREAVLSKKDTTANKIEKEAEYKKVKEKLEEIKTRLTEDDYKTLEKEGFAVEDYTIEGLEVAINRIKASRSKEEKKDTNSLMAKADRTADTKTKGSSAKTKGSSANAADEEMLIQRLREENLPTFPENIAKVKNALELSSSISDLDDRAKCYLIANEAKPSPENLYKAIYSNKDQGLAKLSEKAWSELKQQAAGVMKEAGYEVNEDNLKEARWIIESKLPLTVDTFEYKKELDQLQKDQKEELILDRIVEGMKQGENPKDVALIEPKAISGQKILKDLHSISPETIHKAVTTGTELTIHNLVHLQEAGSLVGSKEQLPSESSQELVSSDKEVAMHRELQNVAVEDAQYEEIKARRQLEEIRLKMTLEAASQLEKQGLKVETERLEKVVAALRELENRYYEERLKEADARISEASLQTLRDTTESLERLRSLPCKVLGSTLSDRKLQTIPGLLEEGAKLQAEMNRAGTAYETLMTVPNKEYGDSIRKAFANASSLLAELKLENTEANQRAVRILGYNQMEITENSIEQVKSYDLELSTMMKNLHPAVTVRMIKEGLNPLDMTIGDLNQTIDRIKEEQGITSEEKYSTYLRKLEKTEGISEADRKAYIGIYRLLYNVEKSDGAALGAVIKAGREVSLDHLLTAIRTDKKGRLDAIIDDEFGTLQGLDKGKETITEQLQGLTQPGGNQQEAREEMHSDRTEYLNRLLKELKDSITPEGLKDLGENMSKAIQSQSYPMNGSASTLSQTVSDLGQGLWETLKSTPIEKLYEQLNQTQESQFQEDELFTAKLQELRELCKNSEQSIRFLNDYRVPNTPLNLVMANHVLSNGESPIKRLLKLQKENIVEKTENNLKEMTDLSDTLIDKHSMEEVYTKLEMDAKAAITQACSEEKIDSRKLAELKTMGQQIKFLRTMAEKEYYQIPIETNQGITNMNLTILRGTQTSGKVSVTISSEQLGNLKAELLLKDKELKGYISSDNRKGLELLQASSDVIHEAANEAAVNLKQLDYVMHHRENEGYSYQHPTLEKESSSENVEIERTLYRMAKAIVQTVRAAESSGVNKEQAVS